MTDEPTLIASLRRAVAAAPDDVPLRLHLAEQLVAAGLGAQAAPRPPSRRRGRRSGVLAESDDAVDR
ncbi:hypothetical protein [Kineosporia sp. A_224]|uniref:hypothetical protein n=1 Tax=Kineosporia sp. A_224 TaxID=1962180 RepID=UPI000B4ABBCD|nr:hypothetical protein [Kineosporia sp. A_224]